MKDASRWLRRGMHLRSHTQKIGEFERLIESVVDHHRDFPGARDVRYMKRTHRPADFSSFRKGEPTIRLTRKPRSVTYVLYWELNNEITHGKATKSGLEHLFRDLPDVSPQRQK